MRNDMTKLRKAVMISKVNTEAMGLCEYTKGAIQAFRRVREISQEEVGLMFGLGGCVR